MAGTRSRCWGSPRSPLAPGVPNGEPHGNCLAADPAVSLAVFLTGSLAAAAPQRDRSGSSSQSSRKAKKCHQLQFSQPSEACLPHASTHVTCSDSFSADFQNPPDPSARTSLTPKEECSMIALHQQACHHIPPATSCTSRVYYKQQRASSQSVQRRGYRSVVVRTSKEGLQKHSDAANQQLKERRESNLTAGPSSDGGTRVQLAISPLWSHQPRPSLAAPLGCSWWSSSC